MRKLLPLLLVMLLTGCREFTNPFDPANNRPPDIPSNPFPVNDATRQDTVGLVLTWTCADPDSVAGDEPAYDIYFGTASPPPRADTGLVTNSWPCGPLAIGHTYYWRIVARDRRGDTTAGPVWSFATNPNLRPLEPSSPRPTDGRTGLPASIRLSWQGGDPNPNDTVHYDLYLGRSAPPPLVARGLTVTEWSAAGLVHESDYYWQVVARDQDSAESAGPVWQFGTMRQVVFSYPSGGEKWRIGSLQPLRWSGGPGDAGGTGLPASRRAAPALRLRPAVAGPVGAPAGVAKRLPATARASGVHAVADSTVLYHSADSGATWQRVGLVTAPGQYDWTVAGPEAASAMVQVRLHVGDETEQAASPTFAAYRNPTSITVTSPAAGARWRVGERQTVRWDGGTDGMDSTVITYSTNNGRSWVRHGSTTQAGSYEWNVPGPETDSALVRVRAHVGTDHTTGQSGRYATYSLETVVVTAPDSTTRWRMLSYQVVRWEGGSETPDSTVIQFRPDSAGSWQRQGTAAADSLVWLVPSPPTEQAQLRVSVWRLGVSEIGHSPVFGIYDTFVPSQPVVTSPSAGVRWEIGSEYDITWEGGTDGMDSTVVLFSTDDGANWQRQGMTRRPGLFRWTVPGPATEEARIGLQVWCLGRQVQGLSQRFRVSGPAFPDTVIATVGVGERPVALAWNRTGNRLYAANRNAGTVSVIDGASNSVIATVPAGSFPVALAWDSVHNKVYCANEGDRSVTVIDGASNAVVATVPVGAAPRDLAVNPVSGKVYVANHGTGANSVTVIDAAADTVLATVTCGQRPRALAWNPVNNRVYVACFAGNSVSVIDGATGAVLDSIGVGWAPLALVVVEDQNHVYVANSGPTSNSVTVINAANNTVIQHVAVGTTPSGLAWNRAANKVYVSNEGNASVSVIRTTDRQVVAVVGVGSQPGPVNWVPAGNMAYVACRGSAELAIINGASDSREKTLRVGGEPAALAWNPAGVRVYVANRADNTVSVIGTE